MLLREPRGMQIWKTLLMRRIKIQFLRIVGISPICILYNWKWRKSKKLTKKIMKVLLIPNNLLNTKTCPIRKKTRMKRNYNSNHPLIILCSNRVRIKKISSLFVKLSSILWNTLKTIKLTSLLWFLQLTMQSTCAISLSLIISKLARFLFTYAFMKCQKMSLLISNNYKSMKVIFKLQILAW